MKIIEAYLVKCDPPKKGVICVDPASSGWKADGERVHRGHWGLLFATKGGLNCFTIYASTGEACDFIQRFIYTNTDPHEEEEAVIEEPVYPNIRLAGACGFVSGYLRGFGIETRWAHPSNWSLRAGVNPRKLGFKRFTPSEHIVDALGMYFTFYGKIETATVKRFPVSVDDV